MGYGWPQSCSVEILDNERLREIKTVFAYVYGLDLISRTDGAGDQEYYLRDGLGSTVGLADEDGDAVASYPYDVFGATRTQTGSSLNEFTFTGEHVDDTGLQHLRDRYFDPSVGRFLTHDPLSGIVGLPLSQNRYPYVLNNPASLLDPTGLCAFGLPCPEPIKKGKDAIGDAVGGGAEFVNEHVVQPTVDFLSNPENVLSAAQIGSGYVAQAMCEGGMNPVCAGALAVYGVASAAKVGLAFADSPCEGWIAAGTAALGAPVPGGKPTYVLAGVSGFIEGVGCATPVYADARAHSKE